MMGSDGRNRPLVALYLAVGLGVLAVTHTDSVDTHLQPQWFVNEERYDDWAWGHRGRERREVDENNGQGIGSQSFTCNVDTARACRCLSWECEVATPDASETPTTLMTSSRNGVTEGLSTPAPGPNCCIQVLSNSDLLQIVTLRLEASMAIYTTAFEETLRRTLVRVIKDYCYLTINPCGLTTAETRQLDSLFTPEGLFFMYLSEEESPTPTDDNAELQVSFLVYVNALSPSTNNDLSNSTLPESSRVLSYDVLEAIIQDKSAEIGSSLDVVVRTPAYRWRDVMTTSPSPTPTEYPFGLSRWQFVWMCIGASLGIFLAFICFISAIKAVVDRGKIKRRIRERREERLRKEIEKDETPENDKEPLTITANGNAPGSEAVVAKEEDEDKEYETPNAYVVQVTVHDVQSDVHTNGPTSQGKGDVTIDVDNIQVKDMTADGDSAIDSEGASSVEAHSNGLPEDADNSESGGSPKVVHSLEKDRAQTKEAEESPANGKKGALKRQERVDATCDSPSKKQPGRNEAEKSPKPFNNAHQHDSDVIQVLSTPERKKAGILTPPKFFSPKKQKDENLMVQSPSSGEGEVGLDNMAFDLVVK